MKDFFSNLTARSFDLAGGIELVRPRLPSLFESAPDKRHDPIEIFTGSERHEDFENSKGNKPRSTTNKAPVRVSLHFKSRKDPHGRSVRLREDGEKMPFHPVSAITASEENVAPIESDPDVQDTGPVCSHAVMSRLHRGRKLRNSRFPHQRCGLNQRGGWQSSLILHLYRLRLIRGREKTKTPVWTVDHGQKDLKSPQNRPR